MRLAGSFILGLTIAILASCQPGSRTTEREAGDGPLCAPASLRIHPFTAAKDWTGDGKHDGIEVLLELQDRDGDPTKASGTALFEVYEYRRSHADPRGERLNAWRGSLLTIEEQRMHWNRISRTYSFQLAFPQIRSDRAYVLQAWFDQGGRRLMSQVVLDAQEPRNVTPSTIPVTQPATRPTTRTTAP